MINTGLPLTQKQHVIPWASQKLGILSGMQTNAITLITINLLSQKLGGGAALLLMHQSLSEGSAV